MKLTPLADNVVLKRFEAEEKTASGIILSTANKEKSALCEVVAVACADAVNRQPVLPHSQLGETAHCDHDDHDHFHAVHPDTDWRSGIVHAVKLGLGNEQYELITVK